MGNSSTNLGATMQPTNDLKKFKTPEELRTSADIRRYPKEETEPKKGIKAVLSLFMTKKQAVAAGTETLNLFNQFNTNSGTDSYIDYMEFAKYQHGDKNDEINQERFKKFNNLKPEKKLEALAKYGFEELGIGDKLHNIFKKAHKNKKKLDINTLAKNKYGIDLSQFKTKEEQYKAISDAINSKYSIKTENKDSIYMQNLNRLKAGKFTEIEKKQLNGNNITDEEQLRKFAEAATKKEQLLEMAEIFANGDDTTKEALINTMGSYDAHIQTGMLGIGILSAKDKDTQKLYAKLLVNQKDLKLTDINKKLYNYATSVLFDNLNAKDGVQFYTNAEHFSTKSAQTTAFMNFDTAERSKVERGEITQEEYNDNYVNLYAASAHQIQEASKAYKYVADNSNEQNREGAMDMLASTAYQIKDSSERDKAIGNLKSSEYYTDKTDEKLNESFQKYITEKATTEDSVKPKQSIPNYQPVQNTTTKPDFANTVNIVMSSNNDDAKNEFIENTFDNMNDPKGKTNNRRKMSMGQGIQLLNELIKEDKLQGSIHESKVLTKLKSLPALTLRNLFTNLNSKTQKYFLDKKIISYNDLELLTPSEERMVSKNIMEKVEEYKADRNYIT